MFGFFARKPKSLKEQIFELLDQGKLAEVERLCLKHYAQLVKEWPEWIQGLLPLQGDPKQAAAYAAKIRTVAEIVEEQAGDSRLLGIFSPEERTSDPALRLGNLYLGLGRYDDAEFEYRSLLRQDLGHIGALCALGRVCQIKGDNRGAILAFNSALNRDPSLVLPLERLGEVYQADGLVSESIKFFLIAAQAHLERDNRARAVQLYQCVLNLEPDHATARSQLANLETPQNAAPTLRSAQQIPEGELGVFAWDCTLNTGDLEYTESARRALWKQRVPGGVGPRLWVPAQSLARLHSGEFGWEFHIQGMGGAQIGVGAMLDWSIGPDWGFYGYLGSSTSAWAYDPSTGDIVCDTRSIEGGLPVLDGQGVVTVKASLPRDEPGTLRFQIDGKSSRPVQLPPGSVLVPAACFLEVGQSVTLANLKSVS